MKVLIGRVKTYEDENDGGRVKGNLAYYLGDELWNKGFDVTIMDDRWDVTDIYTLPNLGKYDVIINTAGVTLNQPVVKHEPMDALKVLKVNLLGAMNLTSKYTRERGDRPGMIIHIGSFGSRRVLTNCSAYSASKAGLAHYVSCAAWENKGKGVSVVGVHPHNIRDTHMSHQVQQELMTERGMTREQVEEIYEDASDPHSVAKFIVGLLDVNFEDISGENFYLGRSDKRGY